MRNKILLAWLLALSFWGFSQKTYSLSLDTYQTSADGSASFGNLIELPISQRTVVLGSLNDLSQIGSYISVYGTKLIVDSLDQASDGTKRVVLRREDGLDFYDFFPTLKVILTPLSLVQNEESLSD